MFDPASIQHCDFCKAGLVTRHYEPVLFRQWSDKGYIFCRAEIPLGVCIGAAHNIGTKTQRQSLKTPFGTNTKSFRLGRQARSIERAPDSGGPGPIISLDLRVPNGAICNSSCTPPWDPIVRVKTPWRRSSRLHAVVGRAFQAKSEEDRRRERQQRCFGRTGPR
jgi:hypothetical protein